MAIVLTLLGFPLFVAALAMLVSNGGGDGKWLRGVVWGGGPAVMAASVAAAVICFHDGLVIDLSEFHWFKPCLLGAEALLSAYMIYRAVKGRAWLATLFVSVQILLTFWYELTHDMEGEAAIFIDRLSVLMILIIGVIGSLIVLYAVAYMKDYHHHHTEFKDRRGAFIALLFVFLAAMFGLVISNELSIMLFCWEITSLCSFLLIGYTKTDEAKRNAFLALTINVGGGLCFALGIVLFGVFFGVSEWTQLQDLKGQDGVLLAVAGLLLATAAMTKSAQMPFSKWLLGAMVAPTPSSALLHSSTMVKAGVYLLIRLSPLMGDGVTGTTVTAIGALTFFITAMMAVAQSDAKTILAYSTISNLGLIVACAGIGTSEALWASVMLIVFHAIAKSLLFLSVGAAEHQLGSRDVEAMDGLYRISLMITMCLVVGIVGMFIAPFGMLISKWAAMKAFIDSGHTFAVLVVAYGGAVTLFFWTKWLGKLLANAQNRDYDKNYKMSLTEKAALLPLCVLVVTVCLAHPLVSTAFVRPFLAGSGLPFVMPITQLESSIVISMLGALFVLPVILFPWYHNTKPKPAHMYMAGVNAGDDASFVGSMGETRHLTLTNWYLRGLLKTDKWGVIATLICAAVLVAGFLAAIGGVGV